MKLKFLLTGLAVWTIHFYGGAQQNIFNVPSVEATLPGKIFIQQQVNIFENIQSNTTFDYGLKHNMEIGVNLFNMSYSTLHNRFELNPEKDSVRPTAYAPLLMVNFLKEWEISKSFKIGAGTQMGANIPIHQKAMKFAGFYYISTSTSLFNDHLKTDAGIFYGNRFFLGTEYTPGIMLGYEYSILHERIHLTGDWLMGNHDLGVGVIGLVVYPQKAVPISLGYQIPNSKQGNQAFVVEFTYIQSHRPSKKPVEE